MDRFNKLFEHQPKPAPPDPRELPGIEASAEKTSNVKGDSWDIPEVSQSPRKFQWSSQAFEPDRDRWTPDEDDEYIAAFEEKPKMNIPKPKAARKTRSIGNSDRSIPAMSKDDTSAAKASKASKTGEPEQCQKDEGDKPATGRFCVFQQVNKFPYKYMKDVNNEVSTRLFAAGKFFERTWDVYYIHPPAALTSKAIVLLPYTQVLQLIEEIGKTFEIPVSVPDDPFTLSFFDDGTPQPIFLGVSRTRSEFDQMQSLISFTPEGHGECPDDATEQLERSFVAFGSKCERVSAATRKKQAAVKSNKTGDRLLQKQDAAKQLRRAQRYLGLRPHTSVPSVPDPELAWAEQEHFRQEQEKKHHIVLDTLDVKSKAPFKFDQEPVIICVDIESYERAHHLITEIGLSTLDTLDLVDLPPGEGGELWMTQIRSRHFRIRERLHLQNKDFCIGDPESFHFGRSEIVPLANAAEAVDSCFEYPFSVAFKHDGKMQAEQLVDECQVEADSQYGDQSRSQHTALLEEAVNVRGPTNRDHNQTNTRVAEKILSPTETVPALAQIDPNLQQAGSPARNLLLLGHDLGGDLAYLKVLGSQIFSADRTTYPVAAMQVMGAGLGNSDVLASIVESLDTAVLYKTLKQEQQIRGLGNIMNDLGRTGWGLHNAGNDARYTLECLVGIVLKARLKDDEVLRQKAAETAAVGVTWIDGARKDEANEEGEKDGQEEPKKQSLERSVSLEKSDRTGSEPPLTRAAQDKIGLAGEETHTRAVVATSLPLLPKAGTTESDAHGAADGDRLEDSSEDGLPY